MKPELVSEERLWKLAEAQCRKATAAWNGVQCKECPKSCLLGRLAVAAARAALEELGVGLIYELGEELPEVTLLVCEVENRAILVRAKHEDK